MELLLSKSELPIIEIHLNLILVYKILQLQKNKMKPKLKKFSDKNSIFKLLSTKPKDLGSPVFQTTWKIGYSKLLQSKKLWTILNK